MELYHYIIAIIGGLAAGFINTLAGSGSAITLTIFTEVMGLTPNLANGTNRIGALTQSLASTITFYKNDKLNLERSWLYIIPTIIGAIIGVMVAVYVSNEQFKSVFSFLMVFMLLVILVKPKRWLIATDTTHQMSTWIAIPAFLALGFYGGFIQMGMGVFFLAVMVLGAKFSIIESNAVKVFVIAVYTVVVLAIFQWKGLVDWRAGSVMAIGQTTGGWLAATYASKYPKADVWAYRLLVAVVIFAIIKLFNLHEYFM